MLAFPENGRGLGVRPSQSAVKHGSNKPDGMFARSAGLIARDPLGNRMAWRTSRFETSQLVKGFPVQGQSCLPGETMNSGKWDNPTLVAGGYFGDLLVDTEPVAIWCRSFGHVTCNSMSRVRTDGCCKGLLYQALILDLNSWRDIGWAVSNRMKHDLAIRTLKMGITLRSPPKGCIFHSDRSSQYCSHDDHKILC